MGKRREYTKEFKESAIELYHRSGGKTRKEVAEGLGISPENLGRWLREEEEGKTSNARAFPGRGNPRDEELFRLKKENEDLRESNEILKKAMAFFVAKNPR
jgi:transposase-like protein